MSCAPVELAPQGSRQCADPSSPPGGGQRHLGGGAAPAQAGAVQTLVDRGHVDAAQRGTTAGIAVLDRATGGAPTTAPTPGCASDRRPSSSSSSPTACCGGRRWGSSRSAGRPGPRRRSCSARRTTRRPATSGAASVDRTSSPTSSSGTASPTPHPRRTRGTGASPGLRVRHGALLRRHARRPRRAGAGRPRLHRGPAASEHRPGHRRGLPVVRAADALPREPVVGIKQGWMCCFSDGFIWRHSPDWSGPTRATSSWSSPGTRAASGPRTPRCRPPGSSSDVPGRAGPPRPGLIAERCYEIGGRNTSGCPRDELP